MVNNIEAFAEIKQAEKRDLILIIGQENTIRNCDQSRLGRVMGAEAMLGVGKEVIGGKVIVKLALYNALNYFGYDGDDGYRSEIARI